MIKQKLKERLLTKNYKEPSAPFFGTKMFITYLTIYGGDKLPPFYIGSTSMKKHKECYHGTVLSKAYKKIYKDELQNNPNLFDSCIIEEFDTREQATEGELKYQLKVDAVNNPLFMNKALAVPKGFFGVSLPKEEHPLYGTHNGLGHIHSYNPITLEQVFALTIPEGWIKGRSPNYKASTHNKGKRWYNNGLDRKMFVPGTQPEGWILGTFNTEKQKENIKKSHSKMDPKLKEKISKAVSKARQGPLFKYYDALYALWIKYDRISPNRFKLIAVNEGFPDVSYHSIIYGKFKVQYENSAYR